MAGRVTNDPFHFGQVRLTVLFVSLERKSSSTLSRMDDGLLIVVAVVAAVVVLGVIGWVIHLFALLIKVAIVAAVAAVVFRAIAHRR
jgi:hypothetical protein